MKLYAQSGALGGSDGLHLNALEAGFFLGDERFDPIGQQGEGPWKCMTQLLSVDFARCFTRKATQLAGIQECTQVCSQ